jgi:hypothetical protein
MSANAIILQGVVKADGTLELAEKVPLPEGKVQVTLQPMPELPQDDPFWKRMQAIWDSQKARGHIPRTVEEVEAEQREIRDEWEAHQQSIERLQEEGRKARQSQEESKK